MTLSKTGADFYDVEVINGVHIPISMGPTNTDSDGAYKCGNPGSPLPRSNVGECNWDLQPPSNNYIYVSTGGQPC